MMSFSTAVKTCFKKSFTFSGRATRAEYWWFTLFTWLGAFIALLWGVFIGGIAEAGLSRSGSWSEIGMYFYMIFLIIVIVPNFSLLFRRLHDVGLSGAWILTLLLGGLGGIFLFIVSLEPSDGNNEYGPKPLDNGDSPLQRATTPTEVKEDNVVDVTDVEL